VSLNRIVHKLPSALSAAVTASLQDWKANNKVARLWNKDASIWTGTDEGKWLGWLTITEAQLKDVDTLKKLGQEIKKAKFRHALLLGMGGSSLCPEVLRMTFGKITGFPEMHVLDSTDPAQIKALEKKLDLKKTICIVSSKSGSTLEPNIFKQYFFARIQSKVGPKEVGNRFMAVTDPGSKMQQVAEGDHFRHIYFGDPGIGGRYSALSHFGLTPGATMGLDIPKFLKATSEMVKACGASTAADKILESFWAPFWAFPPLTAATRSPSSHRLEFTISAHGSNNSSRNPLEKLARASSRSTAKNSPSPLCMAPTASLPTSAWPTNPASPPTPL
jgi:transaldolase/glucose-6-phosphate isomerase